MIKWDVYCGVLITGQMFDLFCMCLIVAIALATMIYGMFFEEKRWRIWTEILAGGIVLVIAAFRIGVLAALINLS